MVNIAEKNDPAMSAMLKIVDRRAKSNFVLQIKENIFVLH